MAERTPIVGGNWKMHTTRPEARALAGACRGLGSPDCDVVLAPPFPWLVDVAQAVDGGTVAVAAQDCSDRPEGAFTGQTSAAMIADAGARWAIVGHSERRHGLGESDALVGAKLRQALAGGLSAIVCVGETDAERDAGATLATVERQLAGALAETPAGDLDRVVIAYEPVWAIGTGRSATPDDAQDVHAGIRSWVSGRYDPDRAASVRIQYGGSVKPDSAPDLAARPDVDGFLVGGASLDADAFRRIVEAMAASR